MRVDLLPLLRCPLTNTELAIDTALEWRGPSELETGILRSAAGENYPVVCGIPILKPEIATEHAIAQLRGDECKQLEYDLLNGQPRSWIEAPERTFHEALYQLVGRWSADYFFYRRSDPTFVVTLSLLRLVRDRAGVAFDLGCGCGHFSSVLLRIPGARRVIGVDSVFKLLVVAQRFIAPQVDYVCCDLNAGLPFVSHRASTVLCSDTFSFLRNQWGCAREMQRLAEPKGFLLVTRLLLQPPRHWRRSYRMINLGAYTTMFEDLPWIVVGDQEARRAYLEGAGLELTSPCAPEEPTCSLLVGQLPGEAERLPFVEPYQPEELCVNPLYLPVDGTEIWQRHWPSEDYAQDYADTDYLPEAISLRINWQQQTSDPEVVNWLRHRILLPLPPHYGVR